MKTNPMFFVRDVEASSKWYQSLIGAKSGHGGDEYEMIVNEDNAVLFEFHRIDGDEHGEMDIDDQIPRGAGVLVYVEVEDVRAVYKKALDMNAAVQSEPLYIELAYHTEFVVKDPDGYRLAIYTRGR